MRVLPLPQAISRMEETLTWTACLEPTDGKIVRMKAHGERSCDRLPVVTIRDLTKGYTEFKRQAPGLGL